MTVVLVHGNPETAATVWTPLVDALGRVDVVWLSPPGFGAPVPPGWQAIPRAYRDWLIAELETLDGTTGGPGLTWSGTTGEAPTWSGWP